MPRRNTVFGRIARRSPEIARLRLMSTLRATKGNVEAAARVLGLEKKQVYRYIIRFSLRKALHELRKQTGWNMVEVRGGERLWRWRRKRARAARKAREAQKAQSTRVDSPPQN